MKKRFFAIFLAVCLVATLLPAGVLAADGETVSVGGVELSGSAQTPAYATTDDEGNVKKLESAEGATITWDGETLTLNNATIKGNSGKGIVYREGDLTIWLVGTNKIGEENDIYSAASGIHVDGSLTVKGDGTLDVVGLNSGITAVSATFSGGTVNATATADRISDSAPMGIYAGSVTVDGGTVTAVAEGHKGYGIYTDRGGVTVTDGSVTAKGKVYGIQTQGDVNISGGKVVAEGGNVGIFVAPHQGFSIKITGGEVTVTGGINVNVTIEPKIDTAITIEYGDIANDEDNIERVVYGGETYTYIMKDRYFHSSTETDISKLANITVGGVGLYGTDYRIAYAKTENDGKVTTEGATANDYNIKWDGTTLTLKDARINAENSHSGIEYSGTSAITIQLEGVNNVTGDYGIEGRNAAKLTISGSGTLNVNGDSSAIYAGGDIEISDATVIATGAGDYYSSDGINTNGGDIIINSGTVTVDSQRYGLNASGGNVCINGGTVSVKSDQYGVNTRSGYSLTICGGTVTIEAGKRLIMNPTDRVVIAPQGGAKVTVKVGTNEQSAAVVAGSPFSSQEDIRDHINDNEDKYFHSETSGGTPPTITGVTVDPDTAEVEVGETQQFTATVTGTGDYYNRSVVWTVSDSSNAGTFISSNGVLTVATDETATTLTVTATAVGDSDIYATATVTVTQPATITGVTVTPADATVEAGKTQQFTATVRGTGNFSDKVTWTVEGNESEKTTIENGFLTVATGETATTLTVTATAADDDTKSDTATVTVTQPATITGVTVDPATATVEAGKTQEFTAKVEGTGDVSQDVTWSVEGKNSTSTTISATGLLTVAADETAATLTVTATAVGNSGKSATAKVTVTPPATITGVTVDPATATVEAGKTQQFTATVTGTGDYNEKVTWTVSGNNSTGTTISEDGVLNIAANETAEELTVTATAAGDSNKSGTATVTVTHPDPDEPWNPGGGTTGNRYCYLTFETRGGSEIDSLRVKLGETVSLDEYLSERAGFDFAGWYSDDSFAERVDELYMNGSKTVYAAWEPFDDSGRGDWFYDNVVYVYENGLMDGVSDTLFDPDGTVTRAQLVTMLWRLDGEPSVNYALPFTDVSGGEWYAEAVRWAAGEGIVNGVSETEFAPNAAVTREQLAAILHRYAQHKGYDVSIGESTNILSYSDFASISEYAISAMQWACGEGIITGVTESTLEPQGTATRAQSAAILMRCLEG